MLIVQRISALALRQLIPGACKALGVSLAAEAIEVVGDFLAQRFLDQSQRLSVALQTANQRAWKAIEVSLAGESFWNWLDRKDDKELRRQVRGFLDAIPHEELPLERNTFRRQCLDELRKARKKGLLDGNVDLPQLARQTADFARFADPQGLLRAEFQVVQGMADVLANQGYQNLSHFLTLQPHEGQPLLVVAVRYFFRRAVEEDRQLFQGLAWATWENIAEAQQRGFADLQQALVEHGHELDVRLDELHGYIVQIHGVVLDIREEQRRQGDQHRDLYNAVLLVQRRLDEMDPKPAPQDHLAVQDEQEKQLLEAVLSRYRALPPDQQQLLPALLNAVAQLQMRIGDVDQGRQTFAAVSSVLNDREVLAESHFYAFQAALERQDWQKALASYQKAASLDPASWTDERLHAEVNDVLKVVAPERRDEVQRVLRQSRAEQQKPSNP